MKVSRYVLLSAVAVILALSQGTPAYADVYKTGSTSCQIFETVWVRGTGSGLMKWYWPQSSTQQRYSSDHGATVWSETIDTRQRSTSWKVASQGGYLDDSGTYGICVDIGGISPGER
jgi:hypothetical protein